MTTEPQKDEDQALAAEYALGLLTPSEARAFEARLSRDPVLRAQYVIWAEDLASLTDGIAPVTPPPSVLKAIESRLFADEKQSFLSWLGLLPALFGGLIAATLVYFVTSFGLLNGTDTPLYTAEIAAEDQSLVVLAAYDAATETLRVERTTGAAANGRVLQLWLIAGGNPPVSLGVLPADAEAELILTADVIAILEGGTLAISDEPPGGSTTGAPTGAVLAVGAVNQS